VPYTKEQLRTYWQTHKDQLNHKRREKRRLAKFGLAIPRQVSQNLAEVSHDQPKMANLSQVSHGKPSNGKPNLTTANPKLTHLIQE